MRSDISKPIGFIICSLVPVTAAVREMLPVFCGISGEYTFHFGQLKKYLSIERNKSEVKKKNSKGPLVQWLELQASTTGGVDLIPSQETKIPYAMQLGQKKKRGRNDSMLM